MPVSKTTPGRLGARVIAPIRVAFRQRNDVGTRDEGTFAAQWLAYALPCQRFADALAGICIYSLPVSRRTPLCTPTTESPSTNTMFEKPVP